MTFLVRSSVRPGSQDHPRWLEPLAVHYDDDPEATRFEDTADGKGG